jgi:hypothetical protein
MRDTRVGDPYQWVTSTKVVEVVDIAANIPYNHEASWNNADFETVLRFAFLLWSIFWASLCLVKQFHLTSLSELTLPVGNLLYTMTFSANSFETLLHQGFSRATSTFDRPNA